MNIEYMFAAYALIILAIFAYTVSFARRQQRIEREIALLRRALEGDIEGASE